MGRLDGKVAIVTGGGSGMGRATAILFAKEGARLVVAGRRAESIEETVGMIREAGDEAIFVKTDVSKTKDVKNMVKTTIDTYGKLDVLFNNAAVIEQEVVPLHECKEEDFDKVIAVNLRGVFLCMKYAIPEMLKTGGGSIINQGSNSCIQGAPNLASYSASKGGVASLSMAAAMDYLRQNIRINWTIPGLILTPMIESRTEGDRETLRKLEAAQPLGRFGAEDEIANLALFLASDESSYITATGIKVDGALSQLIGLW